MKVVKLLSEINEPRLSELGGKGYSLVILFNNSFNVPKGFVVISDAFVEYLKQNELMRKIERLSSEINEHNFQEKSKEIKNLILNGKTSKEIALEIKECLNKLNVQNVSIRSSAVSEDSLRASFAGLHDTFLNVKTDLDSVLENVKKCWASLFNKRAINYRIRKKIPHLEGMAVVVQDMIQAEISGTIFTAHPDKKDASIILIESSWGLGEAIVAGLVTPDRYIVDKKSLRIIDRKLGRKKVMISIQENGTVESDAPIEKRNRFSLNNRLVGNLSRVCLKIEKLFSFPQDIEWCIHKNKIWILQSRFITGLEEKQ